jgi:hypothetical protein
MEINPSRAPDVKSKRFAAFSSILEPGGFVYVCEGAGNEKGSSTMRVGGGERDDQPHA